MNKDSMLYRVLEAYDNGFLDDEGLSDQLEKHRLFNDEWIRHSNFHMLNEQLSTNGC